jgi:hypothetical protein
MTIRLLEADLRASSMMLPADSPKGKTQASNFSRRSRSASARGIETVSIPN